MTDRDRMTHNKDMRQDRDDGLNNQSPEANRANQQAASRPPVDAEHSLDERGHMTATPHEGSSYQPLRMGSDEDRQRSDDSNYVIDQGAAQRSGDQHMTSRQRGPGQHGDAIRESQSAPGGGSVFQPLAADPRNLEETEQGQQSGNPAGQNQQGLNDGRSYDRRDADRGDYRDGDYRDGESPRGMASDPRDRRP